MSTTILESYFFSSHLATLDSNSSHRVIFGYKEGLGLIYPAHSSENIKITSDGIEIVNICNVWVGKPINNIIETG